MIMIDLSADYFLYQSTDYWVNKIWKRSDSKNYSFTLGDKCYSNC